jgi:protease II
LDFGSIKDLSYGRSKFWAFIVDDHTDYSWSISLNTKSDLKNKMFTLLSDLKISGNDTKFIHCYDSGKNNSFMTHVKQMDTTSSLNSRVQELPNAMIRWNVSFKPSMGGLEQH